MVMVHNHFHTTNILTIPIITHLLCEYKRYGYSGQQKISSWTKRRLQENKPVIILSPLVMFDWYTTQLINGKETRSGQQRNILSFWRKSLGYCQHNSHIYLPLSLVRHRYEWLLWLLLKMRKSLSLIISLLFSRFLFQVLIYIMSEITN